MKSLTMKALALAVLGLAGGTAMAACPTIGGSSSTPGGGGAWTSQTVTADTFGNSATGLNGTSCGASSAINVGAASNAKGFVTDTSPQNESRYRFRFYIDISGLTGLTVANRQVRIFSAQATTPPAGAPAEEVSVALVGGNPASVRFFLGDTGTAGNIKIVSAALPTATTAGQYRIEGDLNSTAGTFRYWVLDAAADNSTFNDSNPTGSTTLTDTGWSGVKQVNLGLFITSTNYRSNLGGQALVFDEFDSRRQTFIGQ
jgi:hypothetical protein